MTEDFVVVGALVLALAVFVWAVTHMISGAALLIPGDAACQSASECAAALGLG